MLYIEAVADIDRGYWEVGREKKAELTALQKKGQKKEVRGRREAGRGGAEKRRRRRREGGEGRVGWGGEREEMREEMREERKESEEGRIEELRERLRKEGK